MGIIPQKRVASLYNYSVPAYEFYGRKAYGKIIHHLNFKPIN